MKREWLILPSALLAALLLSGCEEKERPPVPVKSPAAAAPAASPAEAEEPGRAPSAAAGKIPRLVPFETFSGRSADRDVFIQSTAPVSYGVSGSSVIVIQTAPPPASAGDTMRHGVPVPLAEPAPEADKVKPAPRPIY